MRFLSILVLGAALALPLAAPGKTRPPVQVLVVVRGNGSVTARPSTRTCGSRCVWLFRRGAVAYLRAKPADGSRFVGWSGACSGQARCVITVTGRSSVVARFAPITDALVSWSPHVSCTPVLTTIEQILGSQQSPVRGALEAGGGFQPHLAGGLQQHLLDPPCSVGGTPAFVEIHDVLVTTPQHVAADGDIDGTAIDPNRSDIADATMKTIHIEIDHTWIQAGVAAPPLPPAGTRIDLQGFVFWDPAHVDRDWHSFSGWELHPVAAWRPAVH